MHSTPSHTRSIRTLWTRSAGAVALGLTLLVSTAALAGEVKFGEGADSLPADDDGNLTAEARKGAIKELDKVPGEDEWDLKVWMKLDKPKVVEGPLYVEFWQTVDGKDYIVHRHEIRHDGSKYWSESILLEGKQGFNKNRAYKVYVVQNDGKKDIRLAQSSIKLVNSGREPEPADEGEEGEGGEPDANEQDVLDSLAGPDEEQDPAPDPEPPTTESPSKKKGCSVVADYEIGFSGVMVLLFAGIGFSYQRRRRA